MLGLVAPRGAGAASRCASVGVSIEAQILNPRRGSASQPRAPISPRPHLGVARPRQISATFTRLNRSLSDDYAWFLGCADGTRKSISRRSRTTQHGEQPSRLVRYRWLTAMNPTQDAKTSVRVCGANVQDLACTPTR
jgi:hypothetical protein